MSSSSSPIILKAGGNRNDIVDEKEAKEIISRFEVQKQGSNGNDLLLSLDLSCRSWTPKAMNMVLLEYLSQQQFDYDLTKVETLHLSDIIASQNTEDGLTILNTIADVFVSKSESSSSLRCLDLSDNALGDRGMDKLVPLLSSSSLSLNRITFRNCGLGLHSITVFVDSIINKASSSSSTSLTDLILDKNMLGVDGAKIVGEKLLPFCESLQHFSYAGCRPQRSGSKYICDGLAAANAKSLRYLNLDDCTIGDGSNDDENDGVTSLCVALRRSSGLRYLNLRDGDMGPDGWKQVADALSDAKASLTHLILESNQIGSDEEVGITALTDYIRNYAVRTLIELNVEANELGDDGLRQLLCPFRADWNVLESFNLNDNELEDPIPLIMAAGDFPNLKKLDVLDDNDELSSSSSSSARGALKKMYKDRLVCSEDDEDEDDDDDDDEVDDKLSKLMGIMKL